MDVGLYEDLVKEGVVGSFLTLMSHDNSDVAISTVSVLVELLDALDDDAGDVPGARRQVGLLANAFVDGGGLDLLAANLGRFDESVEEDARGVEDSLALVEALLDLDRTGVLQRAPGAEEGGDDPDGATPSVVACLFQTAFLPWLVRRIEQDDDADDGTAPAAVPVSPSVVRLHASEVLSAILQHEDYATGRCGSKLAALPPYATPFDDPDDAPAAKPKGNDGAATKAGEEVNGIEGLLVSIAAFRKADPQVEAECEFLENCCDALAAALRREDNVGDFVAAEGIELMLRCLRQRVHAGGGALRVLDFALSGAPEDGGAALPPGADAARARRRAGETLVRAGGLKLLLPLFMGRKSAVPRPAACSEGGGDRTREDGPHADEAGATGSKRAKKAINARKKWLAQVEQNTINVMYALTRYIDKSSKHDAHARLLVKFVEEDCVGFARSCSLLFVHASISKENVHSLRAHSNPPSPQEKCDRAIELCLKYDERARVAEYRYFRSDAAEEAERRGAGAEDLGALAAKLRGGGDTFHRASAILAFACVGSRRCRGHILDQLKLQGSGISGELQCRNFHRSIREGWRHSDIAPPCPAFLCSHQRGSL